MSKHKQPLSFKAYGVCLELLGIEHLELVRTWRNHPDVRLFMCQKTLIDRQNQRQWFARLQTRDDQLFFIAYFQGIPVACANLKTPDTLPVLEHPCPESGFYLAPLTLRQSMLAFLPALAFHQMAFQKLNCQSLRAKVLAANQPALRFNRTLGYRDQPSSKTQSGYQTMMLTPGAHQQASIPFRRFHQELVYE